MTHFSPGFITNPATGYTIENAVWFDGSADELTWTPGVDGDGAGKKFTISWWQKLLSDDVKTLMSFGANGGDALHIQYEWGANKYPNFSDGSNSTGTDPSPQYVTSNMLERDFTAWSHWVYKFDSDQASAADRHEIFKNGVALINGADAITWDLASVQASSGRVSRCTMQYEHNIGNLVASSDFKGFYIADFILVDNQGLDADSFGEYDDNGVWVPIDPSGLTFGTNGVWLDFAVAPGTGNGAGTDVSGNDNHFTETSMTAAQQVTDTCTDDAEIGVGNFCLPNPLDAGTSTRFANGNKDVDSSGGGNSPFACSFAVSSGKWYWEVDLDTTGFNDGSVSCGVAHASTTYPGTGHFFGNLATEEGWYAVSGAGSLLNNSSTTSYGTDASSGSTMMFALDLDNEKFWVGLDGTWFTNGGVGDPAAGTNAAPTTIDLGLPIKPAASAQSGDTLFHKFAENEWSYTAPTGFKALNTASLPAPTVTNSSDFAKPVIYTGNGTAIGSGGKAVTGVGFQPDFVWIKNRDAADSHMLFDAARGVTKYIISDTTAVSATDTESLSTFDSDGFTVGNNVAVNTNTEDYVAFCLKAGGAGSSNTTGSINTTKTSVATHGGFSISTYTGTAANATVGHGLSRVPEVIITKNLADTDNWAVYHSGNTSAPETEYLVLNLAGPTADDSTYWNDTAPTSSVFSVGSVTNTNGSSDSMVAYCFARTPGLIGIGSYIGNANTDGPYVVVYDGASGFKPAWVMLKRLEDGYSWHIHNSAMSPYNPVGEGLNANDSSGEASWGYPLDFTANGFKLRTTNGGYNGSATYIYLAFAENPFGGSGVAQARAR